MNNIQQDFIRLGLSITCIASGLVPSIQIGAIAAPPNTSTANTETVNPEQARAQFYARINQETSKDPRTIVVIDPSRSETMRDMLTAARAMLTQRLQGKSQQAHANANKLLHDYQQNLMADAQLDAATQQAARAHAIMNTAGGRNDTVCVAFGPPITHTNLGRQFAGSAALVILKPNASGKYNPTFLKRLDAAELGYQRPLLHELAHCLANIQPGQQAGETEAYHIRLHETGADIASALAAVNYIGEDKAIEQSRIISTLRLNKASTPLPDHNHVTSWGLQRALKTGAFERVKGKSLQDIVDVSYQIAETVMSEMYPHLNDPSLSAGEKLEKTKAVDQQLEAEANVAGSWLYSLPHKGTKDRCFLPKTLTPHSAERMLAFKDASLEINPYPHSRVAACWQKLKDKFPAAVGYAEQQVSHKPATSNLHKTSMYQAPSL
jgi:hypothetical protein